MLLTDCKETDYPTYDIDLNAPPEERWNELCREESANMEALLDDVFTYYRDVLDDTKKALLPKLLQPLLKDGKLSSHLIGLLIANIAKLFGQEYVKELQGIANATGIPIGHLILANMMYDLQYRTGVFGLGCSSFSFNLRGTPVLARNMDWAIPETVGKHTRLVRFHRGNSHYESVSVLGSVGVLSAMCPGKWAMTLNMAPPMGVTAQFQTPVMHRIRAVCDELGSYRESVAELQAYQTHSPFFMHVVGTQPKEHCVITGQVTDFSVRTFGKQSSLIQTNHYLDEDLKEHNPSGESWEEDGGEYYDDTFDRYNSLEDELRKKPASLKASMEILSRGVVCRPDTQHSMLFCPKTGSSKLSLRC